MCSYFFILLQIVPDTKISILKSSLSFLSLFPSKKQKLCVQSRLCWPFLLSCRIRNGAFHSHTVGNSILKFLFSKTHLWALQTLFKNQWLCLVLVLPILVLPSFPPSLLSACYPLTELVDSDIFSSIMQSKSSKCWADDRIVCLALPMHVRRQLRFHTMKFFFCTFSEFYKNSFL